MEERKLTAWERRANLTPEEAQALRRDYYERIRQLGWRMERMEREIARGGGVPVAAETGGRQAPEGLVERRGGV
jgi:hypothetical protein